MSEAPVGRRREFDSIVSRLGEPKPGVIVVTGPVGSGRTNMLRHVEAAAVDMGYRVLGTMDEPISVDPTSTIADVRRRLEGVVAEDEGSEPAAPSASSSSTFGRALDWITSRAAEHQRILELLRQMAPVLVLVDGYRAGPAFNTWLVSVFTPLLHRLDARVAIVIADSADRLRSFVDGTADLAITLGPLDADEVRSNLAEGTDGLVPPLTDDELDHYVKAAVDEPALVKALFDVFRAVKESTIS